MKHRLAWMICVLAAFFAGIGTGFVLSGGVARAEQEFGPLDVKSVPENFVLGGNKEFAILRDLLTATLESQKHLENIERNTGSMIGLLQRPVAGLQPSGLTTPPPPPRAPLPAKPPAQH